RTRLPRAFLETPTKARSGWSGLPIDARLQVPPRALERLPELVRPENTVGTLALDAEAHGTLLDPELSVRGSVSGLTSREGGLVINKTSREGGLVKSGSRNGKANVLDASFNGSYAKLRGELAAQARAAGRGRAELRAHWTGPIVQLARAQPHRQSPIEGDATLRLDRFPLEAIPPLRLREVSGTASGWLTLRNYGRDAAVESVLDLRRVRAGEAELKSLTASVSARGDAVQAALKVQDNAGFADARVRAKLAWEDRLLPEITVPVEAKLDARRLRIAPLLPFVRQSVSELDGRIDANLTGHLGSGPPQLSGIAELQQGVIRVPAIGQRFHDITARLALSRGEARLEKLSARADSGKLTGAAHARLDGLTIRSADARIDVSKREKIPVTVEGAAVGDAWGKVSASMDSSDRRALKVKVDVPELHVELPETEGHRVEDLKPAQHVHVGVYRSNGGFVTLPLQPLEVGTEPGRPILVDVKLDNVWIVRRNQARVQLTGNIQVAKNETSNFTGQILLKGGVLDISGKRFEIERGVVTFHGSDASNPTIVATARWDSPADYRVYADFVGSVKNGKLTLRSDPPLTQDEVLSLLLFGNTDGSMGTGSGNAATTAVGVAGSTAARGLNRMLSDITQLDVSARVDTSTGSSRPELVVQVSPRVSARLTQALGEPAPGQPPDRTFLTLDTKITGRWALSTVVGDKGASAVNLIWRRRY
ncbi:MAG TPA: translocation/assembly module TamB domain-containing protein, partial [Polyangiaceae bacterium]